MKHTVKLIHFYFFISLLTCSLCHSAPIEELLSYTMMRFQDQDLLFYKENVDTLNKMGTDDSLDGEDSADALIIQGLLAQYGFFGADKSAEKAIYNYTQAIKKHNSPLARCNLAALLIAENPKEAQRLIQEAVSNNGYTPALYCSVIFDPNSMEIQQNPQKSKEDSPPVTVLSKSALNHIQIATQQTYAPACLLYAEDLIKRGNLLDEEKENVKRNLQAAADQELPLAQYKLAIYYAQGGAIFKQDRDQAKQYLDLAAQQDYPPALYRFGKQLYKESRRGDALQDTNDILQKGIKMIKKAADRGHANAAFFMGKHHAISKSPNELNSAHYMKIAADQQHPEAAYHLAMYYKEGKGVKKDKPTSKKLLQVAAGLGNADAQTQLALIKLSRNKASLQLLTLAEQQKHPHATYCLGEINYTGDDKFIRKPNFERAFFFFHSALARDFGTPEIKLKTEEKIKKAETHALKKYPSLDSDWKHAFNLYEEDSFEECYELFSGERVRLLSLHMDELLKQGWNTGDTTLIFQISQQPPEPAISNLQAFLKQYGLFNWDKAASIEDAIASYTADDPSAWCHIGILNIDNERFDDAEQLFRKASNEDFPTGHYGLAKCLFHRSNNSDSEQTLKQEALNLLQQAAKQAFAPAQYCLGCHIMKTELLKLSPSEESSEEQPTHISHWQNIEKATQLISDAADQKFAPAEYTKALLILKGNIFIEKKRKATAKKLIKSAAEKGYAPAMNALTLRSMKTLGGGLNSNTRATWLFQGATEIAAPMLYPNSVNMF